MKKLDSTSNLDTIDGDILAEEIILDSMMASKARKAQSRIVDAMFRRNEMEDGEEDAASTSASELSGEKPRGSGGGGNAKKRAATAGGGGSGSGGANAKKGDAGGGGGSGKVGGKPSSGGASASGGGGKTPTRDAKPPPSATNSKVTAADHSLKRGKSNNTPQGTPSESSKITPKKKGKEKLI